MTESSEFDPTTQNPNPDPTLDFPGEQVAGQILAHEKAEVIAATPAYVPEGEEGGGAVGEGSEGSAPLEELLDLSEPTGADTEEFEAVPDVTDQS